MTLVELETSFVLFACLMVITSPEWGGKTKQAIITSIPVFKMKLSMSD